MCRAELFSRQRTDDSGKAREGHRDLGNGLEGAFRVQFVPAV